MTGAGMLQRHVSDLRWPCVLAETRHSSLLHTALCDGCLTLSSLV